jgi:hypothetical protein
MEETLLQALEEIVKRGKTADGFKKEHWREVAEKVRAVYQGPAELDWERVKSKFEDKYRPLWGKWADFLASGLSGWVENEEGLPQSSEEIMDKYFSEHPEFRMFRYNLPTGYNHLIVILGDRVATGEFGITADAESSEEWDSELPSNDEEDEDSDRVQESIERSKSASISSPSSSRSPSVASSRLSSISTKSARKEAKERGKQQAKDSLRKQVAEKVVKRSRNREKKADKLMRGVSEFEGDSVKLMKEVMSSYEEASQGPIPRAIMLADDELLGGYSQEEIFQVYDLLQDEAKAHALLAMKPERRSGWLRYELEKVSRL